MSQRGDSGTQTRITNARSAGARPHRNKPRQPMIGPRNALKVAARIVPAGSMQVESPTIQPRFEAGTNSWISGKSTAGMPPTPKPTMKRMTARKIQPPGGVSAMVPVPSEKISTVAMNTLRRPILSPSQPKNQPPGTAATPDANSTVADWP